MSRPELDDAAFTHAGLAFIESPGRTDARRVEDAIRAYLHTVANIRDGLYPSWAETRETLGWDPVEVAREAALREALLRIDGVHADQAARFKDAARNLIGGAE